MTDISIVLCVASAFWRNYIKNIKHLSNTVELCMCCSWTIVAWINYSEMHCIHWRDKWLKVETYVPRVHCPVHCLSEGLLCSGMHGYTNDLKVHRSTVNAVNPDRRCQLSVELKTFWMLKGLFGSGSNSWNLPSLHWNFWNELSKSHVWL